MGRTGEDEHAPDLAIEVVWTSGGLDKLAVYAGLGVHEVWFWRDGRLTFHVLRGARSEAVARSELPPALDCALVERLMTARTFQAQAVRDLRAELRSQRSRQSG